jgi:hypothetical protein
MRVTFYVESFADIHLYFAVNFSLFLLRIKKKKRKRTVVLYNIYKIEYKKAVNTQRQKNNQISKQVTRDRKKKHFNPNFRLITFSLFAKIVFFYFIQIRF